jgi:hypothetical protein
MLKTSQGNDSQNEPQHQQGVEAPTDFGCHLSGNYSNEINIAIVGTHEADIDAN